MRLVADHRLSVDLDETSDVVTLPSGAFLVVSDTDARAAIVTPDGTTFVELEGLRAGESGLEAVTFDAARGLIVSYDEERREVLSHHYGGEHAAVAPLEGRRELRFGKRKNKGVEGLAMFGDKLLCANEDKPRGLYVVEPSADEGVEVELDPAATDACDDFSGLAHDPRRGDLPGRLGRVRAARRAQRRGERQRHLGALSRGVRPGRRAGARRSSASRASRSISTARGGCCSRTSTSSCACEANSSARPLAA
jgi:hypothetical protein